MDGRGANQLTTFIGKRANTTDVTAEQTQDSSLLTIRDLSNLPPPEWLIEGIVAKNSLVSLYGEPGLGKTFIALDFALCVASGKAWNEHPVLQGNVVYICAEGFHGIPKRVEAWCRLNATTPDRIRFYPEPLDMLDKAGVRAFIGKLRNEPFPPDFIIIDTMARCFGDGDENASKDMKALIDGATLLRKAFPGSTVMLVHHCGKDPSRGQRGHSSLTGAVDTILELSKRSGHLLLRCRKQKDAEEFKDISFKRAPVSIETGTSCIVELLRGNLGSSAVAGPTRMIDPRVVESNQQALEALKRFPEGTNHSKWRKASGLPKTTFNDALARLQKDGVLTKEDRTYRVATTKPKAETGPEGVRKESPAESGK